MLRKLLSPVHFFFLMYRRPPRPTRTDTLFPYTTLFRSHSVSTTCGAASRFLPSRASTPPAPHGGERTTASDYRFGDEMNDTPERPVSGLDWWRTLGPTPLIARRQALLLELVALSRGTVSDAALGQAALARPEAALRIVGELPEGSGGELRGSWFAWGAAYGDRLAALMLVRELDRRIAVLERQSRVDKGRTGERRLLQSLIVAWFATLPMPDRSEEHTSELQSLMRNSYAVF